jgi:hypothetical protein
MTGGWRRQKTSRPEREKYSLVQFTFPPILRLTVSKGRRADKAKNVSPMPKNGEPLSGPQNKNAYTR